MASILLQPKKTHGIKEEMFFLSRDDVKPAFERIGLKVGDDGVVYTKKGSVVKCSTCGDILTVDNVGTFFPGSVEAICKKFQCFIDEMTKIEERLRRVKT